MFSLVFFHSNVVVAQGCEGEQAVVDEILALNQRTYPPCDPEAPIDRERTAGHQFWDLTNEPGYSQYSYFISYRSYNCLGEALIYISAGLSKVCNSIDENEKYLDEISNPSCKKQSIVKTANQVLGESIPLVGASFRLNYYSNWVVGRKGDYKINVGISGATIDPIVTGFQLAIKNEIGSNVYTNTYGTSSNQSYLYTWNGLLASSAQSWGRVKYTSVVTATGAGKTRTSEFFLGNLKAKKLGLGGWIPSVWSFYDFASETQINGDGTTRAVKTIVDGSLFRVADQNGKFVNYYNATGLLIRTKFGLTGVTAREFTYDGQGRLLSITEPFSQVYTFNRSFSGDLLSISIPNTPDTSVTLNLDGYLETVTNPKSEVYTLDYLDADGLLTSFEKPNGVTNSFVYDTSSGNLLEDSVTDGSSLVLSLFGKTVSSTTAMGRMTSVIKPGNLDTFNEKIVYPDGSEKYFFTSNNQEKVVYKGKDETINFSDDPRFYDSVNLTSQARRLSSHNLGSFGTKSTTYSYSTVLSDPNDPFSVSSLSISSTVDSNTTVNSYNPSTKLWTTTSPEGAIKTKKIDNYERVVETKVGNDNAVEFVYSNELLTEISQGSNAFTLTYDPLTKLLTSIEDSLSNVTTFTYDSARRLYAKIFPDLRVVNYSYDSNGNLIRVTPPGRPFHDITMNFNGKIGVYAPPALDMISDFSTYYTYNDDKQLTQVLRPDSQEANYSYHMTTGRLQSISGLWGSFSFSYDVNQVRNRVTDDNTGNYIAAEFANGFLIKEDYNIGDFEGSYGVVPNAIGKIGTESVTTDSGTNSVIYVYNDDEKVSGIGSLNINYTYPSGRISGTTIGVYSDVYSYDGNGNISTYQAKRNNDIIYSYSLVRDDLGRVVEKSETLNEVTSDYDYFYDSSSRLIEVKKNNITVRTYSFDSNSNRTGGVINGTTTSSIFNDQDSILSFNVNDYAHDKNGDLLTKTNTLLSQVTTYEYDIFGGLKEVVLPCKTVSYEIDPHGRRVGVLYDGILQKRFMYDFSGRIVAELDSDNNLAKRFVYGSKFNVPDFVVTNADTYRIFSDYLGSIRAIYSTTSHILIQRMEHDEFGRVLQDTNRGFTPFGFAGGIYDPDTDLVRFGLRDYDPEVGRWTNKDPIRFEATGTNLYNYVSSDPVNKFDPTGLTECPVADSLAELVLTDRAYLARLLGSYDLNFGDPIALWELEKEIDGVRKKIKENEDDQREVNDQCQQPAS